ncbi:MAG: nicotinate phosphoribosyltransferase, partial [Erysipelotrichaceae bacterium]
FEETIDINKDLTIYHQMNSWKNKTIEGGTYEIKSLLVPIFEKGRLVYDVPTLKEIREYSKISLSHLWDEVLRFEYPQT